MYAPFLVLVETMIFLVYNNLLITSKTVVFLTVYTLLSILKGVYLILKIKISKTNF